MLATIHIMPAALIAWFVLSAIFTLKQYRKTRVRVNTDGKLLDDVSSMSPCAIREYAEAERAHAAKVCLDNLQSFLKCATATKTYQYGPQTRKVYTFTLAPRVVILYMWGNILTLAKDEAERARLRLVAFSTLGAFPEFAHQSRQRLEAILSDAMDKYQGKDGLRLLALEAAPPCEDMPWHTAQADISVSWTASLKRSFRTIKRFALASTPASALQADYCSDDFSVIELKNYV